MTTGERVEGPEPQSELLDSLHETHTKLVEEINGEKARLSAEHVQYSGEEWRQDPDFMYRLGRMNRGDDVVKMLHAIIVRFGDDRAGRTLDASRITDLTED